MKDIIRQVLKEEVVIRNTNVDIFEHSYVTNVLGIKLPLNESYPYSEELRKKILQEQLLFEGFWDGLTKMAGQSKEFFVVLKKIFSDPSSIGKWGKSIEVKIINGPLRAIRKFLNFLKERLDSWDMPKFSDIVNKILEGINGLIKKIYNTDGWKGALLMTGLGLAVKWVWNKVGDFVEGGIDKIKSFMVDGGKGVVLEKFSEWFNGEFKKIFSDVVKNTLGSLGSSVVSSLTGIGAFIDWAKKAFNGIKFVLDTFGGAVSRFNRERKVGAKVGNIQL